MSNDTTFEDLKKDYTDLSIEKPSIISSTEREKMLLKTARSLPDNPADSGMKASAVKPKFYSFATDTADSLYAYFNRAIWVINTAFDNVIEKLNTQFGDNKDQIDDILDAISSFKTSYLSYVEQMKTTITDINSDITTINGNIDTIETSISDLEESISTANGRIDSTIESINTTNTNLATTNSNLETTNTNLSNEITNRENAINGLIGNASEGYKTLGQLQSKLLEAIDTLTTTISNHKNATGNVHTVYGSQVAMSDSNSKTITSALNDLATQIELLGGFDDQTSADFSSLTDRLSAVENHTSSTSNPHNVTKSQVGLGSVDNTSDLNKPISNATQQALDLKADKKDVSEVNVDLEGTGQIVSIPENVTGYGTIEKFGGKSYKSENLIVLNDVAETTTSGITYSIKNGVIKLNGTAKAWTQILKIDVNNSDKLYFKTFTSGTTNGSGGFYVQNSSGITYNTGKEYNGVNYIVFFVNINDTYTNRTYKPMLVKGSTPPTEFKQGFEGIKIEYPTNVKVEGVNKWSLGTKNINANTNVEFAELNLGAGTYTLSTNATNGKWVVFVDSSQFDNVPATTPITFTVPTSYTRMRAFFNGANTNVDFMLNAGSKVLPYTPYTEQNLPQTSIINYVSNELKTNHSWTSENASKWLGLGVSDSNIIDYANKKAIVKYGIRDYQTDDENNSNVLTDLANTIYELATPIEIDISTLETETHFECESNGSIIHDNIANYKYSFPVSLKGQVELNFEHDKEQQRDIDNLKKEIDLKANKEDTQNAINKSLYNLGAFDTISGNVITRQTGYVDLGSLDFGYYAGVFYCLLPTKASSGSATNWLNSKYGNAPRGADISIAQDKTMQITQDGEHISIKDTTYSNATDFNNAMSGVKLIYELATSYTEEIIEGQPLITLDSQGSQWLREEWEKGLNLLPTQYSNNFTISFDTYINYPISKGTYTIKPTNSGVNGTIIIKDINGIELYNDFWVNGFTFTINSDGCYIHRFWQNGPITTNIMLNKGSTALPYQPYKGSLVHSSDLEAVKSELNQVVSTNTNNISSLQTSLQTNTNNIATNTSNISSLQTSVSAINGKLLTYIDCTLDDNDDISCTFDTSVITKENAQNYAVKMKVYNSDSEQHNYQYLYFDKIECYEPEGGGTIVHNIYYRNPNHTFLLERTINGSNAIDEIGYENGYNVKKAISAMKADFASDDHTKGTIEERLTALGFKEGVMSLSGYTLTDSTAPNTVKKQGKYCIANLDVSMDSLKTYSITVPNDFKPKQATTFYAKGSAYVYAQLTHYVIEVTIDTSGVINLPASPNGFWSKIEIKNAGWELA